MRNPQGGHDPGPARLHSGPFWDAGDISWKGTCFEPNAAQSTESSGLVGTAAPRCAAASPPPIDVPVAAGGSAPWRRAPPSSAAASRSIMQGAAAQEAPSSLPAGRRASGAGGGNVDSRRHPASARRQCRQQPKSQGWGTGFGDCGVRPLLSLATQSLACWSNRF